MGRRGGPARELPEVDEQLGGLLVVAAVVDELGVALQHVDMVRCDAHLLLQVRDVEQPLRLQLIHTALVLHEVQDWLHLCAQGLHRAYNFLAPLHHGCRWLLFALSVDVNGQVHHVSAEEHLQLALLQLSGIIGALARKEIEQRQEQMAVEEAAEPLGYVVAAVRHAGGAFPERGGEGYVREHEYTAVLSASVTRREH